jgi:hypothetical protein
MYMLIQSLPREGLNPLYRAGQALGKSAGEQLTAWLSKDQNRHSALKKLRNPRFIPELIVKEWNQLRIIWRMIFPKIRLFGQKVDMSSSSPEIYPDCRIGKVQTLQDGKREQEITERTLVYDDYLPG